jgi:predicted helicase
LEQKKTPLRVIMGNPPYSVGQKSANDNAQNQSYPRLEARIAETYVKYSTATLNKSVYDSYVKAFRWSADRIDAEKGGVIAFITNSGWLDKGGADGMRKCFENEFSSIYIFDLRGAIKGKIGETARREGQNIFNIMTGVAITIFVKNPNKKQERAEIYYKDIGDYLSRKEKFEILKSVNNILSGDCLMKTLVPNNNNDWLNLRSCIFESLLPLEPEKKFNSNTQSFFFTYALGVSTNRDAWVYNFSTNSIKNNMKKMIKFYNEQRRLITDEIKGKNVNVRNIIDTDPQKASWSVNLVKDLESNIIHKFDELYLKTSLYRPFAMMNLYFDKKIIERPSIWSQLFPTNNTENFIICINGIGFRQETFSCIIANYIVNLDLIEKAQCFPLYWYEKKEKVQGGLFEKVEDDYIRHDAISDFILDQVHTRYGLRVTKEDIFYYVYGLLHSSDYRKTFANDLKKMLPRLPLVEKPADFWAFSQAGRQLAELHLNYEDQKKPPEVKVSGQETGIFTIEKMKFDTQKWNGKKTWGAGKWGDIDKSKIIYNTHITISNVPEKAYQYIVNGKSAIEWIMERYAVTTHKESGIRNDPNDWAIEHNNPRYILDLLLSVITVSVKTVDVINSLPKLEWK